jgi:hypothetical protein
MLQQFDNLNLFLQPEKTMVDHIRMFYMLRLEMQSVHTAVRVSSVHQTYTQTKRMLQTRKKGIVEKQITRNRRKNIIHYIITQLHFLCNA